MRVEALANPGVLLWARRMAGLNLAEAAHKASMKPERLADWEEGELRPTVTQLRKLADIYKRPLPARGATAFRVRLSSSRGESNQET